MQYRPIVSLLTVVTCAMLALGAAAQAADKVDPTGTWSWSTPGRGGGEPRKTTLKLKLEGQKLTGEVSTPGRQGGDPRVTPIENGKLSGDEISFTVTREFGGNKMVQKYSGKVTKDTIKGKIESTDRDGNPQSRDWEAKREAAK